MKKIQITLNHTDDGLHHYQLCDVLLEVNQNLPDLVDFKVTSNHTTAINTEIPETELLETTQIFNGTSWLAEDNRQIQCYKSEFGYLIKVPDCGNFLVDNNGQRITELSRDKQEHSRQIEQLLLGPPLMLAFALNNLFAFHASAVKIKNRALLFVGESGYGKSTLAKWLAEQPDVERIADDISVVRQDNNQIQHLPDFVQLKLSSQQQARQNGPIPLAAIVLLKRDQSAQVRLKALESLNSYKTLLNHSVAAQLFDSQLSQTQLKFLSELNRKTPVYSLTYPNGKENIPNIAELLRQEVN